MVEGGGAMVPIRVAHVLGEFPTSTESFIGPQVRPAAGYHPEIWAFAEGAGTWAPGSTPVEILPLSRRKWVSRLRTRLTGMELRRERVILDRLQEVSGPNRPMVVHAHFGPQGHICTEPCRRLSIPLVVTFYGFDLGLVGEPVWARRYGNIWESAALVLAEGPAMRTRLIEMGAQEERVRVLPLALPVDTIEPRPRRLPADAPVRLIQVARLVPKKGVDFSIRAIRRLREAGIEATLEIIGDGPLRGDLEALVRECGVEAQVTFLGGIGHSELQQHLAEAHLLVQPSRMAENGDTEGGAPYVLLEAQAAGMCVVGSDHADLPFVLGPESGFLFPEADLSGYVQAIVDAVAVSTEWADRGVAGREFVRAQHDADVVLPSLMDVYRTACGLNRSGA